MHSPMQQPVRLYRPKPTEYFEMGIVAKYDAAHNIVTYDKEFFDLTFSDNLRTLREMTDTYLLATTER